MRTLTASGSKSRSRQSAIHWGTICDMRQEAEIRLDTEVFYKNRKFTL